MAPARDIPGNAFHAAGPFMPPGYRAALAKPLAVQSWIKEPGAGFAPTASERVMELPPGLWLNFEDGPAQFGGFPQRGRAFDAKRKPSCRGK